MGGVSYQVFDNSQSESLSWVSTFISQQQQINFTGNWMLVAEWKDVPEYLGESSIVSIKCLWGLSNHLLFIVLRPTPFKG